MANWVLRTSPKFTTEVNISSIRVFDQIRDPERPGFDPGCRRAEDLSSPLRVQTGPGIHSAPYKMSTGYFPRR